jgi:hypothetical protein
LIDASQASVEKVVTDGNKFKNKEVQLDSIGILNKVQLNSKEIVVTQLTLLQNMGFFAPKVVTI